MSRISYSNVSSSHSCTCNYSFHRSITDVPKYRHLINLGKLYENIQKKSTDNIPDKVLKSVWNETERLTDTNEYLNVVDLWLPLSENCLPVSIFVKAMIYKYPVIVHNFCKFPSKISVPQNFEFRSSRVALDSTKH